ncbi:MAG: hypothetical protein JNM85_01350 [Chthonomonas sp.]|nr:hypothetical protein [Chthonomonas sp.]
MPKSHDLPPEFVAREDWISRRAKLFQTGVFLDKGVTITQETLQTLEGTFRDPVPVLIEHARSPLELGFLTQVSAEGEELFGLVQLTPEANALIERSGAKSLSLGLSNDMTNIREVSLVSVPRIPDAKLFSAEDVWFTGGLESVDWQAEYDRARKRGNDSETDRQIDQWLKEGKLIPSQAAFAKALLRSGDAVEFGGQPTALRDLLIAMIERQPPHAAFHEVAPGASGAPATDLDPEEAAFYRRYFPEMDLNTIAKRKRDQH